MSASLKIILTSKENLKTKYQDQFSEIEKILSELVIADKGKDLDTQIVYIDDKSSAKAAGITHINSVTRKSCKEAVDEIYHRSHPIQGKKSTS